jgi:hypothetical protein
MKQFIFSLFFIILCTLSSQAQVGINTATPNTSAALDVTSTDKGLLIPRVSSTANVTAPTAGMMVYQTGGTAGFYFYSTSWNLVGGGSGAPIVTKAQRDALPTGSLPVGSHVMQTDNFPGLYYWTGTHWRCLSSDSPVRIVEYNCSATTCPEYFVQISPEDHTVMLTGVWGTNASPWWELPDATTCAGRRYTLMLRSRNSMTSNPPCIFHYDNTTNYNFIRAKAILDNNKPTTSTLELDHDEWQCGFPNVKDYTLDIMSNGTQWIMLSYTKNINN